VLEAIEDGDIGDYVVMDSTYEGDGKVSNHFRHVYVFPDQKVKKGELVILYTRNGKGHFSPPSNGRNVGAYFYYWDVKHNVWNNDSDSVTLMKMCE